MPDAEHRQRIDDGVDAGRQRADRAGFSGALDTERNWSASAPIGAIAAKLKGLELKDLYSLQSICEDARRSGRSWGKMFWGALKQSLL